MHKKFFLTKRLSENVVKYKYYGIFDFRNIHIIIGNSAIYQPILTSSPGQTTIGPRLKSTEKIRELN